jgi:hypothetical protein
MLAVMLEKLLIEGTRKISSKEDGNSLTDMREFVPYAISFPISGLNGLALLWSPVQISARFKNPAWEIKC